MKIKNKRKNLYVPGFKICKSDELCFLEKKYNSTYGELTKCGAFQLFSKFPMQNKIFCDLGSGIGNVLYYVMSIFPTLNKCIGVELSQERHYIAIEKYRKFVNNNKMEFYNTDLLEIPVGHCDYIYISNLCFPEHLNRNIGRRKKCLKHGIIKVLFTFITFNSFHHRHLQSHLLDCHIIGHL